jgi:hypothetical protein
LVVKYRNILSFLNVAFVARSTTEPKNGVGDNVVWLDNYLLANRITKEQLFDCRILRIEAKTITNVRNNYNNNFRTIFAVTLPADKIIDFWANVEVRDTEAQV